MVGYRAESWSNARFNANLVEYPIVSNWRGHRRKPQDLAAVCLEVSSLSAPRDFFLKDFGLVDVEAAGEQVFPEALLGSDDGPAIDDGVETTNWLGVVIVFQDTF